MITFGPMSPLVVPRPAPLRPPLSRPRGRLLAPVALLLMLHAGAALSAQSILTHTDDAIPIPGGWVRFSVGNAWTRYDSRFGQDGAVQPLGAELSTDSLGARQFPLLAPIEG